MAEITVGLERGMQRSLAEKRVSLCEVLDRVLNKGAVLTGELVISVADIELLYVGVNLLVSSVETLLQSMDDPVGARNAVGEGAR